jgi:protein-tyrosine-phosphatase
MTRFTILAVCTANICRSPTMEILFRRFLDPSRFSIGSAGMQGWIDAPVDSMVVLELARLGVSADGFSSRGVAEALVDDADLIVAATRQHRADLLGQFPSALRKTFTLREFSALVEGSTANSPKDMVADAHRRRSEAGDDIDLLDPFRRPPAVHRAVADQIAEAVRTIAGRLSATQQ